ncbi:hypothetical protein C0995_011157 [Termitomyces sp. Mi166|nr:hypothetical protein C0995_011157 [Termitomyces sp. Mi166\
MDANTQAASSGNSTNAAASTSAAPTTTEQQPQPTVDMIGVLGNLLKSHTGEQVSNERMAQILLSNMATLVKQGKLNQAQIMQPSTPSNPALRTGHDVTQPPSLGSTNPADYYPAISQTLNITNPGAVQWTQTRPTLTGGIPSGRISGTPAQVARPQDDATMLSLDDNRSRRKNTPGDQSMRRTIQDLVASVDPNVKIEPEVEDLLLSIADEFIDSVTNFACRLAKHRGGDSLEVKDLQLHLERNHNIRIPGFALDETRISLSQTNIPAAPAVPKGKNTQGTSMTLRSQRLSQVAQSKREAKLM